MNYKLIMFSNFVLPSILIIAATSSLTYVNRPRTPREAYIIHEGDRIDIEGIDDSKIEVREKERILRYRLTGTSLLHEESSSRMLYPSKRIQTEEYEVSTSGDVSSISIDNENLLLKIRDVQ